MTSKRKLKKVNPIFWKKKYQLEWKTWSPQPWLSNSRLPLIFWLRISIPCLFRTFDLQNKLFGNIRKEKSRKKRVQFINNNTDLYISSILNQGSKSTPEVSLLECQNSQTKYYNTQNQTHTQNTTAQKHSLHSQPSHVGEVTASKQSGGQTQCT